MARHEANKAHDHRRLHAWSAETKKVAANFEGLATHVENAALCGEAADHMKIAWREKVVTCIFVWYILQHLSSTPDYAGRVYLELGVSMFPRGL